MNSFPAIPSQPDISVQRCLREVGEQAAREGGRIARELFASKLSVSLKSDGSEVSDADHAAQAAVIACIQARRPDDALLAEETLAQAASPANTTQGDRHASPDAMQSKIWWCIDPIDGTRNYVRGIPLFCCSVAAMVSGFPVAGAIYVPMLDQMYSASLAEGAFLDGRKTSVLDGGERLLLVAIPSRQQRQRDSLVHTWVDRLVIRNIGSTAMHFAMVAAGRLDAAFANDSKLWDIAAAWALVTAAGGVMTTPDARAIFPIDPAGYGREEIPCIAAGVQTHGRLTTR